MLVSHLVRPKVLELGEEPDVERIAIEDADGIVRVNRGDQAVSGVGDGAQMPGRDKARHPCHREVLRCRSSHIRPSAAADSGT